MTTTHRALPFVAAFSAVSLLLGGCSDQSRMNLYVDQVSGASATAGSVGYMDSDLMGNFSGSHCYVVEDFANVTVRLESPGSVGPVFDARVTGVSVAYFYYDPTDGVLRGPVTGLGTTENNFTSRLTVNATTILPVVVVPYKVKAWAVGTPLGGVATAAGGLLIHRLVAVVTVSAEDGTGKTLSAAGRITIHLDDYGPYPVTPIPPALAAVGDECYNKNLITFWSTYN